MLLLPIYKRDTKKEERRVKDMLHKGLCSISFYSTRVKLISMGVIYRVLFVE